MRNSLKIRVVRRKILCSHGTQPFTDYQNYLPVQLQKITCNVTNV